MTRMMWIASCAALALTAPAAAKDRGKDRQASAEQRSQARQAAGAQRSETRAQAKQDRQPRREMRVERPQRAERRVQREMRIERPQRIERQAQRALKIERPQRAERRVQRETRIARPQRLERRAQRELKIERPQRAERQVRVRQERQARRVERARTAPSAIERRNLRTTEPRIERRADREGLRLDRRTNRVERREARMDRQDARRAFAPVRSWKDIADRRAVRSARVRNEGDRSLSFTQALPIGQQVDRDWYDLYVPLTYRARYVDTPDYYYRYDDDAGYLYRIDRDDDIVSALFPLLGGGGYGGYYGIGQSMPYAYRSSWVPYGYQSLYYDTPDHYYRYAGGSIYQVDPASQLIVGLVALLTGQNFGIGQMLPASYNAYNVPLGFRDRYYDTQDAWYRYDDGYIYEVDPYSRLIEASYPVYGDGYYVGSEWPVAYPDYNVPYGYRDLYADSDDWQYRYANGGIYQVDPQSHLIQALVALVTGNQFAVGQPMPLGYDVYNVPTGYRDRYYDTASSWYRYDDGFVYEVDPRSGLIQEAIPVYA